jgi:hypothetical protein
VTSTAAHPVDAPLAVAAGAATDPARAALDAALLGAHARGDRAALIGLYAEAAEAATGTAAAFYLTHAYIFALEAGDARARALKARLVAMGADIPDAP